MPIINMVYKKKGNTVQTFDFQNDGALSRTGVSLYGTPSYTSGQGWTIGSNSSGYQSTIVPPASVYEGELKKVKIWMYKGIATGSGAVGSGIMDKAGGEVVMFSFIGKTPDAIVCSETSYTTPATTGEVVFEMDLDNKTCDLNGTSYSTPAMNSALFKQSWANKTLGISLGRWSSANGNIYVRKVEITTS